jgi:hypothetical protein
VPGSGTVGGGGGGGIVENSVTNPTLTGSANPFAALLMTEDGSSASKDMDVSGPALETVMSRSKFPASGL